ncbi:MAG: adenine phosphoribosyltransferase [Patescibacteria group bacterium]|nr:adenine phosphoribosyltransferase [Patescibacteria group bacterium]
MDLKSKIRQIPNWPIKGVNFKDITTLLEDKLVFHELIDQMCRQFEDKQIDKLVAIDARGFLLASAMAYKLGTGLCIVRKKGKLPCQTIKASYQKEYGPDTLTLHHDTIKPGEKILLVDDLIATGGTLLATIQLVEKLAGEIVGINVIIDLPFLGGSRKLNKYDLKWLVSYDSE